MLNKHFSKTNNFRQILKIDYDNSTHRNLMRIALKICKIIYVYIYVSQLSDNLKKYLN